MELEEAKLKIIEDAQAKIKEILDRADLDRE
jgi:vacuolar-type H+-ATPase subunit E/Vma4